MKNKLIQRTFAITAAGMALTATDSRAAALFTETAGDPFYDSGWDFSSSQPDNFGWFTSTTVTSPGVAGRFLGNSTNLAGGSGGNINTNGRSWGMFGQSGGTGVGESNAFGFLKDGAGNNAALSVGQSLSLDLAVNFRNGVKGVSMRDASDGDLFTFSISGDDYFVMDAATGNGSIGDEYSNNTVFNVSVTQTTLAGGIWEITRSGGVSDFDSGTYTGTVSNFQLFVSQTEGGSENDLFANNISVVPEPSAAFLLGAGGLLVVLRRRR